MQRTVALVVLFAAALAAAQAAQPGATHLKIVRPLVEPNPRHTLAEWERILANAVQPTREKCSDCIPGTEPQHPLSGKPSSPMQTRIVGGQKAVQGQFPWQAALIINDQVFCGGSLLSQDWILTAGHCVSGFSRWEVRLGNTNRLRSSAVRKSTEARAHPQFDLKTIQNDIGVIKLPQAVGFSDTIRPSLLPPYSDRDVTYVGSVARVSGWGKTSDGGGVTEDLNYVDAPVISRQDCVRVFGTAVRSYVMCCSGTGQRGSCNGDSGGPLVIVLSNGKYKQVGIVSFGATTCEGSYPSAYTRVASFLDWIASTTGVRPAQ